MQTRDEIISTMEFEQRLRKLETLVTLLVEHINCCNINNVVNANHLQLLSLNRDEALHRNRINCNSDCFSAVMCGNVAQESTRFALFNVP